MVKWGKVGDVFFLILHSRNQQWWMLKGTIRGMIESHMSQAAWDLNNMKHDMLMCAWTSQRRSKELFSLLSDFIIYCWHEWFRNREPILYIHGSESRTLQIGWLSFPTLLKWRILDFWGVFADPIPHTIPHPPCFCSRYDPSLCEESQESICTCVHFTRSFWFTGANFSCFLDQ